MKKLQQLVTGRRWPGSRRRRALVAGIVAMALVVSGGLVAMAVTIPPANAGGIVEGGPISGENGFPVGYKDSTGIRLEACLDAADPLCALDPATLPNPSAPVSFPDNFPDEFFYQSADNVQDLAAGGRATTVMSQEVAEADGQIRFTEDIGVSPGIFTGALDGRLGPFLRWDPAVAPAAPVGYLGNPDVEHQVVGSPFNTNFVRIEGPGVAAAGQANACTPGATNCVQNNLFTITGKKATKVGFDIQRNVYTRSAGTGGTIDVFAS